MATPPTREKTPLSAFVRTVVVVLGVGFFHGFWFVIVPANVVYLNIIWGLPAWTTHGLQILGWGLIAIGTGVIVHCWILFRSVGQGTPVPYVAPANLVRSGIYRYSRNPMFVAYVVVLVGELFLFGASLLLVYVILMMTGLHARIVLLEEPQLRKRLGEQYDCYVLDTPRWFLPKSRRPVARDATSDQSPCGDN